MAEILPSNPHVVGDTGHTADHNILVTAISDIDTRLAAVEYPAISTKTASYVLALGDANKIIIMNAAAGTNITVPANGTVAFPISTSITILNIGAGVPTIVPTSSNVKSFGNLFTLAGQNASAVLIKYATDTWILSGGLS